ncbi:MAG: response regulator [bacterium]|nr:response regulator [bacterium]
MFKNILLVEDDPFLIDIYTTKFKESGFPIEVASDGGQAIARIKEKVPDLVLLDIVLPKYDGWEILRTLQEENIIKNTKVVVLSNLGQKSDIDRAMSLGAVRYLIKAHYTPSEIVSEVMELFEEGKKSDN